MLIILTIICIILCIIVMFSITKIKLLNKNFIRFIFTGGLNTFNYYLGYLILYQNYHIKYLVSHLSAFLISAFISFFITTYYTFKEKPTIKKFLMFPLTFLPNLIISTIFTVVFVKLNIIGETYASLISMIIAIPITFLISKKIITK
ncbi:MAG: GtrA family protein [Mycoplasmatales bacterium]